MVVVYYETLSFPLFFYGLVTSTIILLYPQRQGTLILSFDNIMVEGTRRRDWVVSYTIIIMMIVNNHHDYKSL